LEPFLGEGNSTVSGKIRRRHASAKQLAAAIDESRYAQTMPDGEISMKLRNFVAAFLLLVGGCARLPDDYSKPISAAEPISTETSLGETAVNAGERHPGMSGFTLIMSGRAAFTSRIALADLAERTIDVQYYIWDSDTTGRILAERLVRAADRGVRVRVIIDDLATEGRDEVIATLDAHPNIEIQVFNPFANRGFRMFDFLFDLDRVDHRMHNKMMIFDNAVAIVGGRNIADIYFQVSTDANYRDLDLVAVGPVVEDASQVFDYFWNGEWSVPISALTERSFSVADLDALMKRIHADIIEAGYPYSIDEQAVALEEGLPEIKGKLVWAPGWVVWDDPRDIERGRPAGKILKDLRAKAGTLERELLIESAYFVLPEEEVKLLGKLVERGVRVRVLTNSLESNDVIAAHAGHAAHREELIRRGVELYELKADAETVEKRIFPMRSRAALHTKALAFDRRSIFVGSFNLDPRSATINTEIGVYVESEGLAEDLIDSMNEGVLPESSYHVTLDENDELIWTTEMDGQLIETHEEPGTSFGRRFMIGLIHILPIEHLL
jgi:putative cardiolipin synthase